MRVIQGNCAEDGCQQISKNSINVFSYQCAYRFIFIILFAVLVTLLMLQIKVPSKVLRERLGLEHDLGTTAKQVEKETMIG